MAAEVRTLEQRTMAKISWRLMPLAVAAYFVAYIDRTNIGFAALTMNRDLGLTATMYGRATGIFFWGYMLFEIPSNLLLHRIGARIWIARIMVAWATVLCATALVRGAVGLEAMRFLLGVAESGFFPGMILYFTYWFPSGYRARALAMLCLAMPASNAVGAAVTGPILALNGWLGIAGWKWIFLLEASPAFLLAFFVRRFLTDRPAQAAWLQPDEREWLEGRLREEGRVAAVAGPDTVWRSLVDRRVLILAGIYFVNNMVSYSTSFFLPQLVKALGLSNSATGFFTFIPFAVATVAMPLWGWSSDRRRERRWHFALAILACGCGFCALAFTTGLFWSLVWMSLAASGLFATKSPFWALPSLFLQGREAAAGIALVNSIGNLGGSAGPYVFGWLKDATGSYHSGLYFLGACTVVAAAATIALLRPSGAPPPCPLPPSPIPESSPS
ncbi:MAG TPA: MFS transporter [Opitutaceae bacterium]|nr:MFS transporter [Opitutaceae bacterium]